MIKIFVIHMRNLKQALNDQLLLKKLYRVIKESFVIKRLGDQKAWIKLCIHMNTELRKKAKNDFEEYFFKTIE